MVTRGGTAASSLMVVDVNGAVDGKDDVIVGRGLTAALFRNMATQFYLSLPQDPLIRTGFMSGTVSFAGGDFTADGRADLVAVNTLSMRRYIGSATGNGTFLGMATVTTSPGPGGGVPAIVGRTVAVANTRLRLYDQRCTAAPPGAFAPGETFVAGGLCASIPLSGTSARKIVSATVDDRNFVLTVNGATFGLYEITATAGGTTVTAVLRDSITMANIDQVAWSPADAVFVFSTFNTLQVRKLSTPTATTASLTTVSGLGSFTVDLAPVDGIKDIAIGEFSPGVRSVVMTEPKTEDLKVLPFSTTTGWNRQGLVETSFGANGASSEERSRAIVVGQFNDDDRLDVAILEKNSGNVIIVRQQPEPCVSFITSSSHGHLANPVNYSPIARFNRRLVKEVAVANADRRPASGFRDNMLPDNAAMCPARFVDVRGHWEKLSYQGTELIIASRGSWVFSSYGVLVPFSFPPIPSLPAITPVDYWLSAGWVLLGDGLAITRFVLAGIGAGTEVLARGQAGSASLEASNQLNLRLREAITDADSRMDPCEGTIYVDLVGHSRGGPVVTSALRSGFGRRGDFNFEVSTTLLDVVDPSPGGSAFPWSNVRPWIRAGYIPGDPQITRVGSEWNSNFYGDDASGEVPPWFLWNLEGLLAMNDVANFLPEIFRAEVIGLPVGYDRQSLLEHSQRTFGAYQGPIEPMQHKAFLGARLTGAEATSGFIWVNPLEASDANNNIRAPDNALSNASQFAFVSATHLGGFLADPRGFDTSTAVGFHSTVDFDDEDEERCFDVDGCSPAPGGCTDQVTDEAGRAAARRDGAGVIVRELVPDFDFRISTGIIENAQWIYGGPPLKDQLPGDELATLRTFIETTATTSWVLDGPWRITSGTVTLPASLAGVDETMTPFIADPGVDYSTIDTNAEREDEMDDWADELDALVPIKAYDDRVRTLADAAARTTSLKSDPYIQFNANAVVEAQLHAASISAEQFLVRVEFKRASNGLVAVGLSGPSLSGSASWNTGTGRQVGELIVDRSAIVRSGIDTISIGARNANIYSVSVRPAFPVGMNNGSKLEFVSLEVGVTLDTAMRLASRSRYDGSAGRLARIDSTSILEDMHEAWTPGVPGWIDGRSATGSAGSFVDSVGNSISTTLFAPGTSFTESRPRGADVFTDRHPQMRLHHGHPGTNVDGARAGFWIEYPPSGAARASSASTSAGWAEEFADFFSWMSGDDAGGTDDDDDDTSLVNGDAVPACLSDEEMVCFVIDVVD